MRDGDGLKLEFLVFACVISGRLLFPTHKTLKG